MQTHLLIIASLFAFSTSARSAPDLALEWENIVHSAQKAAQVGVASSDTGSFGGVHTRSHTSPPKFIDDREGDPALEFYNAAARLFHKWATDNGASHSTTNGSSGNMSLRIKAANGDYFSAIYHPPTRDASTGRVTFVFVDASQFNETP